DVDGVPGKVEPRSLPDRARKAGNAVGFDLGPDHIGAVPGFEFADACRVIGMMMRDKDFAELPAAFRKRSVYGASVWSIDSGRFAARPIMQQDAVVIRQARNKNG